MVLKKIRFEPIDIKEIELFTCSQPAGCRFFYADRIKGEGYRDRFTENNKNNKRRNTK